MYTDVKLTEEEIEQWKEKIDNMTHEELARMYRFERIGHPVFSSVYDDLYQYFENRFNKFGGMTPAISKMIGWGL